MARDVCDDCGAVLPENLCPNCYGIAEQNNKQLPPSQSATETNTLWRNIEHEQPGQGERVIVLLPFGLRVRDDTWTGFGWMNNQGHVSHWMPINAPGSYSEIMQGPKGTASPERSASEVNNKQ